MDLQVWKRRREEMIRQAHQERLAKALRDSRKRRGSGRASSLLWDLRMHAGRVGKLVRSLARTDHEREKCSEGNASRVDDLSDTRL